MRMCKSRFDQLFLLGQIFIIIFFISACSSKVGKELSIFWDAPFPEYKHDLKSIMAEGRIEVSSPRENQVADFSFTLEGIDSLGMNIYGPLNMLVGKLFVSKETLIFYDIFNNQVFKGGSTEENFGRTFGVPLKFSDLVRIIRNEPVGAPDKFVNTRNENFLLYKNISNSDFVEFAVLSADTNMVQYQQKTKSDRLIINVFYDDFKRFDKFKLPTKIKIELPSLSIGLIFNINSYKVNGDVKKPLSFSYPKEAPVIELD